MFLVREQIVLQSESGYLATEIHCSARLSMHYNSNNFFRFRLILYRKVPVVSVVNRMPPLGVSPGVALSGRVSVHRGCLCPEGRPPPRGVLDLMNFVPIHVHLD